ncbi:MAG: Mur ligase family protein [Planctomycetota bacterium]|jgi:UDP-N-acetylmuramate--alanine ligase|nr:Mur ligase family protein [Planctomycetota bacterium]MDP6764110.1 Mur ligase family protein [Planctomycetota bacterium]MDP6988508.1 Mur ligase family protein [Planctomycetota bacterium]
MSELTGSGEGSGLARRVHFVGIGGAGCSGAARLLHARGHVVSGYDRDGSSFSAPLGGLGIELHVGEEGRQPLPAEVELVVRSAAVPLDDEHCAAALARGVEVMKYGELLARLCPPDRTLAVAGTHGKTTTSWMLHHALLGLAEALGRGAPRPGALVGGTDRSGGANAVPPDDGGWFAVEACEYDRTFLGLRPAGAVVTNIEADHLDYFRTFEHIEQAFARFGDKVNPEGLLVLGGDVPESIDAAVRCDVWRIGRELKIDLVGEERGYFRFRLCGPGWATPVVSLGVPGAFNVENAACALALAVGHAARVWRLEPEVAAVGAATALERFIGTERRFESWGIADDVEVVHDYAHHPTEVRVTIETARRAFSTRPVHVLFQPHQFSRTARFMSEFVESLRGADRVVVADVYGARVHIDETRFGSQSDLAEELASRLRRAGVASASGGDLRGSVGETLRQLPPASVLLVLGAGDVDGTRERIIDELALRRPAAGRTLS